MKQNGGQNMSIKFDCKTVYGDPIEIKTPLIDDLVAIVNGDKPEGSDRRGLAVEILRYVNQYQADAQGLPELDRAARQMLLNINVDSLWSRSHDYRLKTVKGREGVERLEIVKEDS